MFELYLEPDLRTRLREYINPGQQRERVPREPPSQALLLRY
jgi:hypothetical protein